MHIYPHISKLITYQSQRPLRAAPGLKKVISEVTSDERDICIFIDEQLRSDGICWSKVSSYQYIVISMDWFTGKFEPEPPIFNGKNHGFL